MLRIAIQAKGRLNEESIGLLAEAGVSIEDSKRKLLARYTYKDTGKPVIGIPMHTTSLGGRDSLYSIVQMPSGIPVATVAINGGANAGLLAAKILATSDAELLSRLKAYSQDLKEQVEKKDARLQEVGYKNY